MTSRYQAYPEYKDTGIEWFKKAPANWHVKRYKHALTLFQGAAFKSNDYVDFSDVVNVRMGNIKKGGFIDLNHNIKYLPNQYKDQYSQYKLNEGDLIIAMTDMSPSLDFLAVPAYMNGLDFDKTYLLNQRVGKLLINSSFNNDYIKYLLLSTELRDQLKAQGLGTVQSNMSGENLYNSYLVAPDFEEQEKIANFLDHETAIIDTLIEKQQQLIQLLKEKRQAVISHAVTKGLNPDVPMRDSGVEWFGDIPESWKVSKLKYLCNSIVDGAHFTPTYVDQGIPFLRVTDIQNSTIDESAIKYIPISEHEELIKRCKPEFGDLLLSKNGTIGVPKVVDWEWEFSIFVSLCLLKLNSKVDVHYVYYFFLTHEIKEQISAQIKQSTVINLHLDKIESFVITLPPLTEQLAIVEHLSKVLSAYSLQVAKAESMTELLKERRTALISAAVTGKIDVRNWQPPKTNTAEAA